MTQKPVYLAVNPLQLGGSEVTGQFATMDGVQWYQIENYDRMRPFFMTIVSDSDHWMFLSSNGTLTAGRRNPEHALFPYYTDDKLHDSREVTGSRTSLLVERSDRWLLWDPFAPVSNRVYDVQRKLYKSLFGNQIRFEELNRDLHLTFSYEWSNSEQYGFVKQARLTNHGGKEVNVKILDGLLNLLPSGIDRQMQETSSTLLDAYKKNELQPATGLGLFLLSSIPVDRPEPSECLRATTVWSRGLPQPVHLLCDRQVARFREGASLTQEVDVRAERGAYFVSARVTLRPQQAIEWCQVAEIDQSSAKVADLSHALSDNAALWSRVREDVTRGRERLERLVARADGLQLTRDRRLSARHFSNVLFNVMRGGVFEDGYQLCSQDLTDFMRFHSPPVATAHAHYLQRLPAQIDVGHLLAAVEAESDLQFERLCYEYLPLSFSRRHGDPSRPWNHFSIELKREDGSRNRFYQGNWRDIFQNWEALCRSFPHYTESVIGKFLNASTADGYNPYRITREGIDWEVPDPDDPWSHIGYWGDHQSVYLLRLLEISRAHDPQTLPRLLARRRFSYANVPYRIHAYDRILADPHNTIQFDESLARQIQDRVEQGGVDGKLIPSREGGVLQVNLVEKLLVPLLAKLTNLVPETGIWMNTQRPEWNDANNALVGRGVSVVTACYLRRFVAFMSDLLKDADRGQLEVSEEVATWMREIDAVLQRDVWVSATPMRDSDRKSMLDELGWAGSRYRERLYAAGFSERLTSVSLGELEKFLSRCQVCLDRTIHANRREDGMYHAYNLIVWDGDDALRVRRLYEMLEGQVAALSSGYLSVAESLSLLKALRQSSLYRADQQSYLLYPDRQLPRFLDKNCIPRDRVESSPLMSALIARGDSRMVSQDRGGVCHFGASLRNANDLNGVLNQLERDGYEALVQAERGAMLELWETLFDHQSYTGRSGTFFGYEGLGCIYWHMVSKLLLAVGELFIRACEEKAEDGLLERVAGHYDEIRFGLGATKNPADYGAFPMDPYSHTPGNAGVQQPGMTGQVKEDILSRWNELGVRVRNGQIAFDPSLLRRDEMLTEPSWFDYLDVDQQRQTLELPAGALCYTYCQVPVLYLQSSAAQIKIHFGDGSEHTTEGLRLSRANSRHVFARDGQIRLIEVGLDERQCRKALSAANHP